MTAEPMWPDPPQPDAANRGPALPGGNRDHGFLLGLAAAGPLFDPAQERLVDFETAEATRFTLP